ncbi:MAG: ATP-binding protein [Candidatus Acidiferrales bacterium]
MATDFCKTALMDFLKGKEPLYWGKVVELRTEVENWLSYIPQTFPHYTRHTVQHSDAIMIQLSNLLFLNEDPAKPVVKLSAMEAYILAAAAYLHDAGMVVSDTQKKEILESESWKIWTTEGPGAKRWRDIGEFRVGTTPQDPHIRDFLADVQTRFLIAEFVRRTHHVRAREFTNQHQDQLGRFAFGDPVLLRTIAAVCESHGLGKDELEDSDRYPERSDILDQRVNVRFLAILLRLGDLLDLSTDRACPLLLNAASPLPAESLAHWTQYQRITQRLTSPDRIELIAHCENQAEHSYLKDWCQWLVDEVQNAAVKMAHAARHSDWQVPKATMDCPEATIRIEPSPEAKYIPSNWRFELDHELVFRRLIDDLYTEPYSFVRELIQNALDASRCQMYLDLQSEMLETPDFATQVPEARRQRYPVSLSLEARELRNALSGEIEQRQVLVIEDFGIGMDRNIIQNYLLQVGRSYYTTYDFQRSFKFVPTSRYGIGFLSVFSSSDHISFETYKPSSNSGDGPLKVVLTGPRNYLLLEKGDRRRSGTRVEVMLREPFEEHQLADRVRGWCRRVEFPLYVREFGTETTVAAERKEEFLYEIPDLMREGAKFTIRAFDIQRYGLEGELYVFTRVDSHGESWDAWSDAYYRYPQLDPRASKPVFPASSYCIHGIGGESSHPSGPCSERLDFRGGSIPIASLSREHYRFHRYEEDSADARVSSRWTEIIKEHLASSERANSTDGWRYKQALVDDFPPKEFWTSLPGTIPTHIEQERRVSSLKEVLELPMVATIMGPQKLRPPFLIGVDREDLPEPVWEEATPAIFAEELTALSKAHRMTLFQKRSVDSTRWLPSNHFVMYWKKGDQIERLGGPSYRPSRLVAMANSFTVGFQIHALSDTTILVSDLFNKSNQFIQWVLRVKKASEEGAYELTADHFSHLDELLHECCDFLYKIKALVDYVEKWRAMRGLPGELYPPNIELVPHMFLRIPDPESLAKQEAQDLK